MASNPFRAINHLIRNDEISRSDFLLQTAYCAKCNDAPYAELTQCSNVCSRIDLVWGEFVVESMPAKECYVEGLASGPGVR